jgi:hypothetical protein
LSAQRNVVTRTLNGGTTEKVTNTIFNASYAADVSIDFTLRIAAPQLESGAFVTSYIPTTSAAVGRVADAASMTGTNFSAWFNATRGTLLVEGAYLSPTVVSRALASINDGTTDHLISIQSNPSTATTSRFQVTTGGVSQVALGYASSFVAGVNARFAGAYAADAFRFGAAGVATQTDAAGTVPTVTQLQIGALTTSVSSAHIRRIAYYRAPLSAAQLQALTR